VTSGLIDLVAQNHQRAGLRAQAQQDIEGLGIGRHFGHTGHPPVPGQHLGTIVIDAAEDHRQPGKKTLPVAQHEVQGIIVRHHDQVEMPTGKFADQSPVDGLRNIEGPRMALGVHVFGINPHLQGLRGKYPGDGFVNGGCPGETRVVGMKDEDVFGL